MKRVMAGLAAGAVWLLAAMPALAQEPAPSVDDLSDEQLDELYCVYDSLGFFSNTKAITDAYMSGDPDSEAYKKQIAEVDDATDDCNADYMWDEDRKNVASMIGLYGVIGDELEDRLKAAGLQDADVGRFYDTVDAMSDEDIGVFVDGVWAGKQDVADRLLAALAANGLKNEAVMINGLHLAEAYILVSLLTAEWLAATPADS